MTKQLKLVMIDKLTKDNIFKVQKNLDKYDVLNIQVEDNLYEDDLFLSEMFCNKIKDFCLGKNNKNAEETKLDSTKFQYLFLINVDSSFNDDDYFFDYIAIQYLLVLLSHIKESYKVCFYVTQEKGYTSSNYFRISAFLNLWLAQSKTINEFRFLETFKDVGVYATTEKRLNEINPKRFAYSFFRDEPSERFLPIITLNRQVYRCLEHPFDNKYFENDGNEKSLSDMLNSIRNHVMKKENTNQKTLNDICIEYYKEFIVQSIKKMLSKNNYWEELEKKFFNSNPPIIVVYIYSIMKSNINKKDLEKMSFESLVEKSFDFSNGLLQLIENSIKHVIEKNNNNVGFFCLRMHHKKGSVDEYLNLENTTKKHQQLKYFLEISVLDSTVEHEKSGIIYTYNENLKELGKIENLSEIFEYPIKYSKVFNNYYSDAKNVANHYGLQIFDSILTANNGLFIVKTGSYLTPKTYSNVEKIKNGLENTYNINLENTKEQHFSGTSYTILLPIENRAKDEISSISLNNVPLKIKAGYHEMSAITVIPIELGGGDKEQYIEKFIKTIESSMSSENKILVLDINEISKSRMQLELLCKAIISVFSNTSNQLDIICLANVCDEYRLLEVMRFISLFYDKTGHCKFFKDKGIYIVSNNLYDLLFCGDNIKFVLENIQKQRFIKGLPENFYNHIYAALNDRIMGENKKQ